jgi:hypothetical protein
MGLMTKLIEVLKAGNPDKDSGPVDRGNKLLQFSHISHTVVVGPQRKPTDKTHPRIQGQG